MGSPLVESLAKVDLAERSIDCRACRVSPPLSREEFPRPYKCCTFQPFWSAFFVGGLVSDLQKQERQSSTRAWDLTQTPVIENIIKGDAVLLPVGIVPPPHKRELQFHQPQEVRAQNADLRCPYYQPDGRCGIYDYRPIECRRYYCSSSSPGKIIYRNKIFDAYLVLQAKLLQEYVGQHYTLQDWRLWTQYLEADGFGLSPHKAFTNWEEAQNYYYSAHCWLLQRAETVEWPDWPVLEEGYEHDQ